MRIALQKERYTRSIFFNKHTRKISVIMDNFKFIKSHIKRKQS